MKKHLGELIVSGIFCAVGLAAIIIIQTQSTTALNNTGATTFKSFPSLYGALLAILSGINFAKVFAAMVREKRAAAAAPAPEAAASSEAGKANALVAYRVAGMFALTVMFALLLKKIPFAIIVFAFLFLSFALLGRKNIWINAAVSAVGSGVVWLVFVFLLKLPL